MTTGNQLFVKMCEELLPEVSSSMSLIGNGPGAKDVIRYLHKNKQLSHEQEYKKIDKISWNDLKGAYKGSWVLIRGDKGTGAIKWNGRTYEATASTGGEPATFSNDKGGNILDFLKGHIGGLRSFYTGADTGMVKKTQQARAAGKVTKDNTVTQETLLIKFKPLWQKAIVAAQADIKGVIANMIKNDAFEKAKYKLDRLIGLDDGLTALENNPEDMPGFLNSAISLGVLMAASHYYPEQTGDIQRQRYGGGSYSSTNSEGVRMLLADISKGDTKKMGTVLAFFKRALISR